VNHPDGALYDPGADVWRAMPSPPAAIAGARLDDFEVAVSAAKIVVITNRRQAAIYDFAGSSWTAVPDAELPVGLKDLRDLGGGGLQLIVGHEHSGALGVGTLARVNAQTARWEIAPLPPRGAPTSLETGIIAWADGQLILWGPRHQEIRYEKVPGQKKDCGPHVPGEPICDPVTPVRRSVSGARPRGWAPPARVRASQGALSQSLRPRSHREPGFGCDAAA
jgi:hypothetical protein